VRDIEVESKPLEGPPSNPRKGSSGGSTERKDGVGAVHRPEHAGVFEAMTDDGFTISFDNAGTDEKVLLAELG
jgi:hypothetical protein